MVKTIKSRKASDYLKYRKIKRKSWASKTADINNPYGNMVDLNRYGPHMVYRFRSVGYTLEEAEKNNPLGLTLDVAQRNNPEKWFIPCG